MRAGPVAVLSVLLSSSAASWSAEPTRDAGQSSAEAEDSEIEANLDMLQELPALQDLPLIEAMEPED